jgi:hypothetical protein
MLTQIHGTTGGWDERGLATVVVPYLATTFADVFTRVPAPLGLEETGRTFTHDAGETFRVDITFEGGGGGGGSNAEPPTYSCTSSFREEPIEAHPKIEELKRLYNGQTDPGTGKVTFPATLEGAAGSNGLAGEEGITAPETRNPMAGVEKYMALDVVWEKKYISTKRPNFNRVGRLTGNPPGLAPNIPNRRAWLVLPPNFVKRGTVYEITEQWQLLPEGTPEEVYNLGGPAETAE